MDSIKLNQLTENLLFDLLSNCKEVLRGNFQNVKRPGDQTEYGKPCLQCGIEFAGHTPRAVLFEAKKRTWGHQKISAIVQSHLQVKQF